MSLKFANRYVFGFNGMEKDDEVEGVGNSLDFGARIYNSRLGKWFSTDPLQVKYPSESPFSFCLNSPIVHLDVDGREVIWSADLQKNLGSTFISNLESIDAYQSIFKRFIQNHDNHFFAGNVLSGGALWHGGSAQVNRGGTTGANGFVTYIQSAYIVNEKLIVDETFLVLVILHEGIHQRKNIRRHYDGDSGYPGYADHYNNPFYRLFHSVSDLHHNQMAEFNRPELVSGMKQFDKKAGTKHSEDWYEAMSWFGLTRTLSWDNFILADPAKADIYRQIHNNELNYITFKKAEQDYFSKVESGTASEAEIAASETEMLNKSKSVDWNLYNKTRELSP